MENTSIPSNICNFNSIECNGTIRSITHNTKIPKSTESIISVGIYLCQIHYNRFILNEIRNINYNKSCEHPKHDEYKNQSKNTKKKFKKRKVPIRLIKVLELDEFAMICNMCTKRTDKDSQYLETEEYKTPISRKNNDDNILKIGNHTYSFRKDILYTGEELQQLESDYQEIITQLKISNETKLSNKIIKMSNILYYNQHRLNLKPIYDLIAFKTILEKAN